MFSPQAKDWIEIIKLLSSMATPIVVAFLGYKLNSRLKSIDDAQWQSRKIVDKRLELYERAAPGLNSIFCFCTWVGYWKDISPKDLIQTKRDLDKTVNIYRQLLSEDFYQQYNDFIHLVFLTYTGAGKDALIRTSISGPDGDRREHSSYAWEENFAEFFSSQRCPATKRARHQILRRCCFDT